MALKLYISKTYDRVEQGIFRAMMGKIGFHQRWIDVVMRCFTSISYSILINENIGVSFRPSRGLRQGDSLSPFLFLIYCEGLSSLLNLTVRDKQLKRVRVSKGGPQISHLLFANDCVLFKEASTRGAQVFKQILKEYENSLGQCINFEKSIVFFSSNTLEVKRNHIPITLGVRHSNNATKYLRLPNMVRRIREHCFQP